MRFLRNNDSKIASTRVESVDENLVIDLIENQKLSNEQASSDLKERFHGVWDLSSLAVRRFCTKRSTSSRVFTEKVTEIVIEASSKVISVSWLGSIWRNSCIFFYYHFKILSPLFNSNPVSYLQFLDLPLSWHFQTRIMIFLFTFIQLLPWTGISSSFMFIITIEVSFIIFTGGFRSSGAGGHRGHQLLPPPPKFSVDVPFFAGDFFKCPLFERSSQQYTWKSASKITSKLK